MAVSMKVIQGKPKGTILQFPHGEYVFGRGSECHVRPNSELISRQHCLLKVSGSGVWIRDLGSSNGTLINGQRVTAERPLVDGDTLQLGPLVLQLSIAPSILPPPSPGKIYFDSEPIEEGKTLTNPEAQAQASRLASSPPSVE